MSYQTEDIAVDGGTLRVGVWRGDGEVHRVVLAVHGITANHRSWALVADDLPPGTLLLAPDLRGRGRSGDLPAPYGMAQHAADCVRVLDVLAGGRCDVAAGHSMGGFVVVMLAARHPGRVGELLLVDGGVPLTLPAGTDLDDALTAGLGPAAERLARSFSDRAAYQDFWHKHPAFVADWSDAVADYVDYDVGPDGPPFTSTVSADAMRADFAEQFEGGPVDVAWRSVAAPVTLLRASRGLQDEPVPLYPAQRLRAWRARYPFVRVHDVDDVNHYTITLGARGARRVADALRDGDPMSMVG